MLLRQAAKLTTLGVTVERERGKLKKLVERGISYTGPRVLDALGGLRKQTPSEIGWSPSIQR